MLHWLLLFEFASTATNVANGKVFWKTPKFIQELNVSGPLRQAFRPLQQAIHQKYYFFFSCHLKLTYSCIHLSCIPFPKLLGAYSKVHIFSLNLNQLTSSILFGNQTQEWMPSFSCDFVLGILFLNKTTLRWILHGNYFPSTKYLISRNFTMFVPILYNKIQNDQIFLKGIVTSRL